MGAIKKHTAATIGNKREEAAQQRGLERVDEGTERLHNLLDRYAGDDGFRVEQVADQFVAFVSTLEARAEGQQTLNLNANGIPSAQDTTPKGLPSGTNPTQQAQDAPVNTEPSLAEKLGVQLLQIVGDDPVKANQIIQFMGRAMSHDVRFFPFMNQELGKLARRDHPDTLVETSREGYVMQSYLDLREQKDALDGIKQLFDRLVEDVTGTVIANETAREAVIRSRTELSNLKKNASHDTIIDAVKTTSGVTPNTGETLAQYLTRAINELKNKAADNSKYYDVIKNATRIDPAQGETFDKYFDRVWLELQKSAINADGGYITGLLNELGSALGVVRNNLKNHEYRAELIEAAKERQRYMAAYTTLYDELERIARANNLAVGNDEGALPLSMRLIAHKRLPGSKIKGI
jgi:hypothetical protein